MVIQRAATEMPGSIRKLGLSRGWRVWRSNVEEGRERGGGSDGVEL